MMSVVLVVLVALRGGRTRQCMHMHIDTDTDIDIDSDVDIGRTSGRSSASLSRVHQQGM